MWAFPHRVALCGCVSVFDRMLSIRKKTKTEKKYIYIPIENNIWSYTDRTQVQHSSSETPTFATTVWKASFVCYIKQTNKQYVCLNHEGFKCP